VKACTVIEVLYAFSLLKNRVFYLTVVKLCFGIYKLGAVYVSGILLYSSQALDSVALYFVVYLLAIQAARRLSFEGNVSS
jgi:hypothetical protein